MAIQVYLHRFSIRNYLHWKAHAIPMYNNTYNVEIHPKLLHKNYFSYSVTVAAGWACGEAGRGGVLEFDFIQFAKL